MSHYEQRLENDLTRIRQSIGAVGDRVESALKDAVHALLTGNHKLAYATVLADNPINRAVREVDKLCHGFIALHLPSAGHLRIISAVIRANIALERIGDYAVTICRESVQLSRAPQETVAREMGLMAEESRAMLHQAVAAFLEGNADKARATMSMADQVDRTFDTAFAELVSEADDGHVKDLFGQFVVFTMLERVSDQAKNICEETVFAVSGETKRPKVYRILFLDEDNSCQSQMAEAIAGKNYPNSGEYASAGLRSAEDLHPGMRRFLEERGTDLSKARPRRLDLAPEELADFHVVVSLHGPITDYLPHVPFHTAALEWDVGAAPAEPDGEQANQRFEEMYRETAVHIRDLMETLRGEGAG